MIRAVLLDAGNTLVELNWPRLAPLFANHGFPVTPQAMREASGRTRAELDAFIARNARSTEGCDTRRFALGLVLDRLAVPHGKREGLIDDLLLPEYWVWDLPTPGCEEALTALASAGYRLGVVSNSDGTVARVLGEAGVAHHFETIVDSTVVGVEKPDPAIFGFAFDQMGLTAAETVYVGDIPSVDLVGASAAGMKGILMDPFDAFPDFPSPRVRSLTELLPCVSACAG